MELSHLGKDMVLVCEPQQPSQQAGARNQGLSHGGRAKHLRCKWILEFHGA